MHPCLDEPLSLVSDSRFRFDVNLDDVGGLAMQCPHIVEGPGPVLGESLALAIPVEPLPAQSARVALLVERR